MIDWDSREEQRRLQDILAPHYLAMWEAVAEVLRTVGIGTTLPRLDDVATRLLLAEAGRNIVRIDETTRQAVMDRIAEGQSLGLSDWEIAHGSPKNDYAGIDGLFKTTWAGRAQTVARTELTEAQLASARERYLAAGVGRMQIVDGTSDTACASRNGTVVSSAQRVRTLHPNCSVSVIPLLEDAA